MKPVAFDIDDKMYGTQLYEHFGGDEHARKYISRKIDKRFLLGTVIRVSKKQRGAGSSASSIHYDIQWEESDLGDTSVSLSVVIEAISLHQTFFSAHRSTRHRGTPRTTRSTSREPFSPAVRKALLHVEETEIGTPESSEDEDDINDGMKSKDVGNGELDDNDLLFCHDNKLRDNIELHNLSLDDNNENTVDGSQFRWSTGKLPVPPDVSNRRKSHVIPSKTGVFATPISSFLAFVPLKMFNSIAFYSNRYAHDRIATNNNGFVCGTKWQSDISINEIMKFFGILFKMVLQPTPGQCYTSCWNNTQWHPYTAHMKLRRFQQIRSVLHFNDNSKIVGSNDAAFKVSWRFVVSKK